MMRALYSLFLYLAAPLILLRLYWRGNRQPAYREHIGERFGFYRERRSRHPLIWVHAVSVGETRAAEPLLRALSKTYPQHRILLTGMTPTGREAARQVYGRRVRQAYLPYDYPGATARFLDHFRPQFGILMETEIWPNLLAACARRSIPVMLANGRLSERSAAGYRRFAWLMRPAFAALTVTAAQSEADAERLRGLGANQVSVCGNMKFDVGVAEEGVRLGQAWRAALAGRPVFLAASTREGEEALLLAAWRRRAVPGALLIVVPRHPQRFNEVFSLFAASGWRVTRRSQGLPEADCDIWLGDSMGEMVAYYSLADLAFVGGSLLPLGGQNLIEAAACACPVLVGPHTFNFSLATEDALQCGAACRVANADDLVEVARQILLDPQRRFVMQQAASAFAASHRGATERILALIADCWDQAGRCTSRVRPR